MVPGNPQTIKDAVEGPIIDCLLTANNKHDGKTAVERVMTRWYPDGNWEVEVLIVISDIRRATIKFSHIEELIVIEYNTFDMEI